jgi:coenzyme F420-reducing hydrogenase gamma subunit
MNLIHHTYYIMPELQAEHERKLSSVVARGGCARQGGVAGLALPPAHIAQPSIASEGIYSQPADEVEMT